MGDLYRPRNTSKVYAFQWAPDDPNSIMSILQLIQQHGIRFHLVSCDGQVAVEMEGYTADLERYDWLVQESPLTRPKIMTNIEFRADYEEAS